MTARYCFLLLFISLFGACKQDKDPGKPHTQDDALIISRHVIERIPQYVSVADDLVIRFRRNSIPDRIESVDGITVRPAISGEWKWLDDVTVALSPHSPLPFDMTYRMSIDMNQVSPGTYPLGEEIEMVFNTRPLDLRMTIDGPKMSPGPNQSVNVTISGAITASDYCDPIDVENMLSSNWSTTGELITEWQHSQDGRSHNYNISGMSQSPEASALKMKWNGGKLDRDFKGDEEIEISGVENFEVQDFSIKSATSPHIRLVFSHPIDASQDLDGLVKISTDDILPKLMVDGNILHVYPNERTTESFQLQLSDKIRSHIGVTLEADYNVDLKFASEKPAIKSSENGVIIPSSQGRTFTFQAINLDTVELEVFEIYEDNILQFLQDHKLSQGWDLSRVGKVIKRERVALRDLGQESNRNKWSSYQLDLESIVQGRTNAIYQLRLGFRPQDVDIDCDGDAIDEYRDPRGDESIFRYRYYSHSYEHNKDPCYPGFYNPEHFITRNVFFSDVAAIVKEGKGGDYSLSVHSISTGAPLGNAQIEIYNFQQQEIAKGVSSKDGYARLSTDEEASFAAITHSSGTAYIRILDGDALSISDFDTSGKQTKEGIDGFIYSDRGVYRPGDSIFLHLMIDEMDSNMPEDIPVELSVYDARGQKVHSAVTHRHLDRIYTWNIATDPSSPTGTWRVECTSGPYRFSKSIRVETIKPNRLRVELDIPELVSYHKKSSRSIPVSSSWLHGAPAADLRLQVDAQWASVSPRFDRYKQYRFSDPSRRVGSGQVTLFNDNLDQSGKANMVLQLEKNNTYPGMLSAIVTTRVFEKGGDFSENYTKMKVSPYASYVGIDVPRNDWGSGTIQLGEDAKIPSVVVDENGAPLSNRKLSIGIYDIDWRWWYYSGDRYRIYELNSAEHKRAFYTTDGVTNASGQVEFVIPTEDMEYGRKLIRICDTESGHCTGDYVYARGWGRVVDEEERNSLTRLEFKSDKSKYQVGDQVELTIPSEVGTRILVSIEDDKGVLIQEWVEGQANQTSYSFSCSPVMAPNVYAHVTLVQSYKKLNNDLPIRMYGVIPIHVSDPKTYLNPEIQASSSFKPKEKFEIIVTEADNLPMNYTIAIVDEGLLDLTNYKTPDPHASFYAKRSLGVKTWDMYDFINYGLPGGPDHIISVGGDGEVSGDGGNKKAIRFKPVVMTAGPFHLDKNAKASHEFVMPNYIGSVRAMVIAKNGDAYGNGELAVLVKTPLMILPTLPRVVSPGEVVMVPVSVFAMEEGIRTVNTRLETFSNIEILAAPDPIQFDDLGEKVAYYKIKVKEELGIGKFQFSATSGAHTTSQEVELDIRNPNPITTEVENLIVQPGESASTIFAKHGMKGTHEGMLELSTMPSLNLGDRMNYLIRYPYGCLEQTTSAAFAQLHLPSFSDYLDQQDVSKNIKSAIRRISKMQMSGGGFSYWPGGNRYVSEWGTSYAGHFLIAARDEDYFVSNNMLSRWANHQKRVSKSFSIDRSKSTWHQRQSMIQQAYRLYSLGLYGSPELSSMNLLRQEKDLPATAAFLLAATYAMNGKSDIANDLIRGANTDIKSYRERSYTYGSELRDLALIAQTYETLSRSNEMTVIIKRIIDKLNSGTWYSTQSLAQALYAIASYGKSQSSTSGFTAQLKVGDGAEQAISYDKKIFAFQFDPDELSSQDIVITNTSDIPLFASIQVAGQAAPIEALDQQAVNENVSLSVAYKDLKGRPIDVSKITQGTDFVVEVAVKNLNTRGPILEEMALTQIIPAAWEIRSGRLNEVADLKMDSYEYQDVRDDRVFTFFDLKGTQTYSLLLNATYEGDYILPPVKVEAMYDKSVKAISKGRKVQVIGL